MSGSNDDSGAMTILVVEDEFFVREGVVQFVNRLLNGLAVASCQAYVPRHDAAPRPNRLFICRQAPGATSEVVEVGDLSRRKDKPDRAVSGVFRDHDDGQ